MSECTPCLTLLSGVMEVKQLAPGVDKKLMQERWCAATSAVIVSGQSGDRASHKVMQ